MELKCQKYTKQQVDYGDVSSSPSEHRCGICTYILHCPGTDHECGIVAGTVRDLGGCKRFDVDLVKWATDQMNLLDNPPTK